jgi:hypothetical protein
VAGTCFYTLLQLRVTLTIDSRHDLSCQRLPACFGAAAGINDTALTLPIQCDEGVVMKAATLFVVIATQLAAVVAGIVVEEVVALACPTINIVLIQPMLIIHTRTVACAVWLSPA